MKWANNIGYKEVATVAVDTPMFPENLLKKLYQEMKVSNSDVIFASSAAESEYKKVLHPVFGLWKTNLLDDLRSEIEKGVRKVTLWSAKHKASIVCFPHELIDPFFNVNTPEDIIFLKEYLKNK
jgi:molybdopterin-guanine dinucleotide biosynthesis protein A